MRKEEAENFMDWDEWFRKVRITVLENEVENLFNLEDKDPWFWYYSEEYTPEEAFDEELQEVKSQAEPV